MQENELYINNQRVDLSSDTRIALTFQINSIADLQNRNGNYSNIFKLPKTPNNRLVFEDLDLINSDTNLPYQILNSKLIKEGFVVVPSGVANVQSVNDYYNVRVNSGNIDYFARIEGLTVGSLFTELQKWGIENIFDSRNNTSNWIYPFICFGELDTLFTGNAVNIRHSLPCLFIKTILERSANSKDFYLSGSFYNSEILEKLILTPDNFTYSQKNIDLVRNNILGEIAPQGSGSFGSIPPTAPVLNPFYKDGTDFLVTVADVSDDFLIHFYIKYNLSIYVQSTTSPLVGGVYLEIYDVTDATVIDTIQVLVLGGTYSSVDLDTTWQTTAGLIDKTHTYRARILYLIEGSTDTVIYGVNYITQFNVSMSLSNPILFNAPLFFEDLFQIKQKDLIKDVLNQFGVLVQTNNLTNVIEYNFFSDIEKNKPLANDWSHLVDVNSFEMVFKFGSYAKQNNFKYKDEETVTKNFGNGYFELLDENLNTVYDAVQMVTSATESITQSGNDAPIIYNFDSGYNFTNRNNRILVLDKRNGTTYSWEYYEDVESESSDSNVPFCYFQQNGAEVNLTFDRNIENNLIDLNYTDLINVIDKVKVCQLFLNTNTIDVQNINFMIPIFLNVQAKSVMIQGYFYINKIENYVKNMTKFELVKL